MRLLVDFAANRSGTAELAWGQRDMWGAIHKVGPDSAHYFNVPRLLAVPRAGGPRRPGAVAAALRAVMARHDALRSLVRLGAAGPYQEVAAAGAVSVELVEAARGDADDAAADLVARLSARSFDDGEQPLRAGFVVCDGAATHVALVFNHVVADWRAADVVVRDLRMLLLRGAIARPPSSQLLDLVREEEAASARSDRAIAQWEALLRTVPSAMFPQVVGAGATPRYARAVLSSPRLNHAARVLARRAGVSTATVLLVAVAMLLRELTGHEVCAITPIVHNRFSDRTRDLVTSLNQLGLFTLGPCGSLPETLVTAYPAVLASYRRARFDSLALNAMIDRMSADRGVPMFPSCCFNDLRPGEDPGDGRADGESELEWLPGTDRRSCDFCVALMRWKGTLGVELSADTTRLPEGEMAALLHRLESFVVGAAQPPS
ncbi:non-ribosomal peptide synthetase condensation domain protein [Microbispora sp. NEAU-D428]|uniref:condensation domain-containing protein n=1 Tax=Microbispora sitophila TaxID=2771537 RepID=UPI001868C8D4|nr:condensation domain-containing protein [Microbispora sitophila]MBE3011737.1 non-ribosomal peptide synthetase condensation domain protein [Microbispora sitophila]